MTIIKEQKEVEKSTTRVVTVCDVCGLPETEIPDNESIVPVVEGMELDTTYIVQVGSEDVIECEKHEFSEYSAATDFYEDKLHNPGPVSCKTIVKHNYEWKIQACDNCRHMLFGALD